MIPPGTDKVFSDPLMAGHTLGKLGVWIEGGENRGWTSITQPAI
jgi:hypothetical protein